MADEIEIASESDVAESTAHKCEVCSNITYDAICSKSMSEFHLKPKTFILGSFLGMIARTRAGCSMCRVLSGHIFHYVATSSQYYRFQSIDKVGLRLFDGVLTMHYWVGEKEVQLNDMIQDMLKLLDSYRGVPEEGPLLLEGQEYKKGRCKISDEHL
ncbi:MAG: hypothetical protein L6R41_006290 [Letrouitia leprolyta]|nr:MAG: hypothetical protein L6R41_006290 [Letrouitia leprolyta]